jgi:serine kinase of HPr protein (carbohydrate metabolism regulator)
VPRNIPVHLSKWTKKINQLISISFSGEKERKVTEIRVSKKLAVPRRRMEYTPTNIKQILKNRQLQKRRFECLKQILSDASANIETNIISASYIISKYGGIEATIFL